MSTDNRVRKLTVKTAQEALDAVRAHLATMTERSGVYTEDGFSCLYRDPEGRKCAFGALIPDEDYDPGMDDLTEYPNGCAVVYLLGLFNIKTSISLGLLDDLQHAHDNVFNWRDRAFDGNAELMAAARTHKLEWKVADAAQSTK